MTPLEYELRGLLYGAMREVDAFSWQLPLYREAAEEGLVRRVMFGPGLSPQWEITDEGLDWLVARRDR